MTTSAPPRPRRGFSLVELLVAVTLLAIVIGSVVGLAVAQQRTYSALASRRTARAQLRDAALLLGRELRPLATLDPDRPDLREASDTVLELLATTGAAIVCDLPGPRTIEIPTPSTDPSGPSLAWWTAPPRPGDVALLFDPGDDGGESDDRWLAFTIADVGTRTPGCVAGAFARPALPTGALRLTLAGVAGVPPSVRAGTPLRLGRLRRWSHYRAADGAWYLGLREWDGASWSETQPAAGPLGRGPGRGLAVTALDSTGAPLAAGDPVAGAAAFRLTLRTDGFAAWARGRSAVAADSATLYLAPRGVSRSEP